MVLFSNIKVKEFIHDLLLSETFDSYYLSEAQITTFNTYHIDGHLKKDFFQDLKETGEFPTRNYSYWKENRNFCFDLMKGKRVPLQFKIVLLLSDSMLKALIEKNNLTYSTNDIGGCFLNIVYASGNLNCTTGTSLNTFSLDKSLEQAWDNTIKQFFASSNYI